MLFNTLFLVATAIGLASSAPSLPSREVARLPRGTWIESLAVRPNGDLLLAEKSPYGSIWTVMDPTSVARRELIKNHVDIPGIDYVIDIAELPATRGTRWRERYVVLAANSSARVVPSVTGRWDSDGEPIPATDMVHGQFSAWTVTFAQSGFSHKPVVRVSKVSDLTHDSYSLASICSIPGVSDAVLIADARHGRVGRLDLATGTFDPSVHVSMEMKPPTMRLAGVKTIRIRDGYLYFSNHHRKAIYRIKITPDGKPVYRDFETELVASLRGGAPSSFILDARGNLYIADGANNRVVYVDVETKKSKVVVGGPDKNTVAGATGLAFGRGRFDNETLYVVTSYGRVKAIETDRP
ncbi:hypothetical protein ACJ41O_005032 [Fusarium nematophilum]